MKESQFIKQNKEKWIGIERVIKKDTNNASELSGTFVQLTDDLSYARTFYANRSVRVYLNHLGQQVFQKIYKNKKLEFKGLVKVWYKNIPEIIYYTRKEFLISLLIFLFSVLVGILSSANDPTFPVHILGDNYIAQTEANIAKGDPMAIYKSMGEVDMFLRITLNNLLVAFRTFILGFLAGIGSIYSLIMNGVMLGTFQYYFFERGLLLDSSLTIWLHGTIEIASIVIAGAAGLILGKGIIFPGTYSRGRSLLIAGKKSIMVMMSTVPLFIIAGFIEGFITRYTDMPYLIRALFIFISFLFIIIYYVWLPYVKGKSLKQSSFEVSNYSIANVVKKVNLYDTRSTGENFYLSFVFFRKYASKLWRTIIVLTILFCLLSFNSLNSSAFNFSWNGFFLNLSVLFKTIFWGNHKWFQIVNLFVIILVVTICFFNELNTKLQLRKILNLAIIVFSSLIIPSLIWLIDSKAGVTFLMFLFPLTLLTFFTLVFYSDSFSGQVKKIPAYFSIGFINLILINLLIMFMGIILYYGINSPITWLLLQFIQINISVNSPLYYKIIDLIQLFIAHFSFLSILTFAVIANGLTFFSIAEKKDAVQLTIEAENFGKHKKVYGLDMLR